MRSEFAKCANVSTEAWAAVHDELATLEDADVDFHLADWLVFARDDQLPPAALASGAPWRTWLILGGRGAGKTRAGAEWVRAQALGIPPFADAPVARIALVAETMHEARSVMVEGVSGLLEVHGRAERPLYEPSKNQVTWANGAIAQIFSADDPDSLRGPQFGAAWVDELAKWRRAEAAWDMLQFGLRLGSSPRVVATTTPRTIPLIEQIMADASTVVTRAATAANAEHLSAAFLAHVTRRYAGTVLGRQELDGELLTDVTGALWRRDWIEAARVASAPELTRIVVAVDPPVTATVTSDACGIIVAGLARDGRAYVLADRTLQGREPTVWARAAVAAYAEFAADRIVAEVNQGGDLVALVLKQIEPSVPITKVRATRGKWVRAEPIAALYAEGRVAHAGRFAELEDQMLRFGTDGRADGASPDRVDALVWALTSLMLTDAPEPSVRVL